jgi:hypothetical protein
VDYDLESRLNSDSTLFDSALYNKLARTAKDYIQSGLNVLDFYIPDLDTCNDVVNCFGPIGKSSFEKGTDRNKPRNFIHPMTATEMWTLATFISQILAGGETVRRVEPRNPEDESKADLINEVLRWNDNQQDTYGQIFHWCRDAVTCNRGVLFDHWEDLVAVELEAVTYEMPWIAPVDENGKKQIDPETGKPYRKPRDYKGKVCTRFRKKRKTIGGFAKINLISPYDFICDPAMPPGRFQEGRFAGHRVLLPWDELRRRSELPVDHYQYVLPAVVQKLKNSKQKRVTSIATGSTTSTSRSFFERQRRNQPVSTTTGSDKITKEEGGVVECFVLQVRMRPTDYKIFPDDTEEEKIEFLISGDSDLLSVNITTNKHDQYPYSVGEARPNGHMQFMPSWAMIIRGPQSFVDYMCTRRRESLARTSGNIFIGNPSWVDFNAFTDPDKDGLFIPITPEGAGKPIDQIIKQVPVQDTTANFYDEVDRWQKTSEEATGAHAPMQGSKEEGDPTATEFVGTQQMAQGRISTIARLLSAGGLVPQTQRIVSNLQQFLPDEMTIRISGDQDQFDPDKPVQHFRRFARDASEFQDEDGKPMPKFEDDGETPVIDPETGDFMIDDRGLLPDIQGEFDVVAHDGALPGTDAKKVAALSRAVESYSSNPALQVAFDRTKPGAIDPIKLFQKFLKAIDLPTEGIIVTREQAQKNLLEMSLAGGAGIPLAPQEPPTPEAPMIPAPPTIPDPNAPMPSAAELPPTPTAEPPGPSPMMV